MRTKKGKFFVIAFPEEGDTETIKVVECERLRQTSGHKPVYADKLEQAQTARTILDVQVERVDVAAPEVGRDRVAVAAQGSYDARDDSSNNSDDSSAVSWRTPAVLKTATSYSARQRVSSQQDGSSSKPTDKAGGGDVVAERGSTASRDSGGGGGAVAGRDSTAGKDSSKIFHYNWSTIGGGGAVAGRKSTAVGPDDFPDSSFSATPAPRFP